MVHRWSKTQPDGSQLCERCGTTRLNEEIGVPTPAGLVMRKVVTYRRNGKLVRQPKGATVPWECWFGDRE